MRAPLPLTPAPLTTPDQVAAVLPLATRERLVRMFAQMLLEESRSQDAKEQTPQSEVRCGQ